MPLHRPPRTDLQTPPAGDFAPALSARSAWARGVALAVLGCLSSCYYLQSMTVPLEATYYRPAPASGAAARHLLVLLPGLGDEAGTFEEYGFVSDMKSLVTETGTIFDVIAVNAHLQYYKSRTLIERLRVDVIEPARRRGIHHVHLVGVSLGGFGSLLYLRERPEEVASVTLLAPYLGEEEYYEHLLALDGEASDPMNPANIWPWLLQLPEAERRKIYLGYGRDDRMADAHALLGGLLHADQTVTVEGGHRWPVWKQLWPALLDRILQRAGSLEQPGAIAAEVLAATRAFEAAEHSRDADAVLAFLAPEFYMYQDGTRVGRDEVAAQIQQTLPALQAFEPRFDDIEIIELGEDAALVTLTFFDEIRGADGVTTQARGPTTLLWRRRDGRWLLEYADADHYAVRSDP